eukprot:2062588-Amphidinium_carterae.1
MLSAILAEFSIARRKCLDLARCSNRGQNQNTSSSLSARNRARTVQTQIVPLGEACQIETIHFITTPSIIQESMSSD